MDTEKRRTIATIAALFIILAAILAVMAANARRSDSVIDRLYDSATLTDVQPIRMAKADVDFVQRELLRRSADDCVLTPTSYGWRCVDRQGRVYKIARQ